MPTQKLAESAKARLSSNIAGWGSGVGGSPQSGSRTWIVAALATVLLTVSLFGSQAFAQSETISGSGLVGILEGATVLTDQAATPAKFSEAPMLADLVKAGTLPPVEQRVPAEPLVLQPLREIGIYGGTWHRAFTGPSDGENGNRLNASDRVLAFDVTGTDLVPSVARDWKVSEDGRKTTIYLRKGMKWSDGSPFTADDFVFWFEDIYSNEELGHSPMPEMSSGGKPGRLYEVDETTVVFEFEDPNFLLTEHLASQSNLAGQTAWQSAGVDYGCYAPAAYLKQFLPKYSSVEEVNAKAKAAGYDNWIQYFHFAKDWQLNPNLPILGPWRTTQAINTPNWVLERNPYYWMVDTEGKQLPYIDEVSLSLAEDLDVVNLKAAAGEFDEQERHLQAAKLPVLLENQERGNYKIHVDLANNGMDFGVHFNQSYTTDPEIARWITSADFRRALSLGLDRDQVNEAFFLGLGTPGSPVVSDASPENPGPEWRTKWSIYDPNTANKMLDDMGLSKKDSDGFRLRTDNGERLVIEALTVANQIRPYVEMMEMVVQQWRKIGIAIEMKVVDRTLARMTVQNNEHQVTPWANQGSERLFLLPIYVIPVDPTNAPMGPEFAFWYASGGERGRAPTDENILRVYDLFRQGNGKSGHDRDLIAQEIWKIVVDQQWMVGAVGISPGSFGIRLVSNKLGNVPDRTCVDAHCRPTGGAYPQQWYFKE